VGMLCVVALTNLIAMYMVTNMTENVLVVEGSPQMIHHVLNTLIPRVVGEGQELRPQG
jgi:hypothetical protein